MSKEQLKNIMKFSMMMYTKLVPRVILLYAVIIIVLTIYLNGKISPIFVFLCVEMSLNWYCVYRISHKSNTVRDNKKWDLKTTVVKPMGDGMAYKYWYCKKCQLYMNKPSQHCVFCKKCYHFKEQHCFVLGACVLRQNMGNFILFCFYASLASVYTMLVMGWFLIENLDQIIKNNADNFNLFENFCFPITIIKLLSNNLSGIFLFLLLNLQVVVQAMSMGFGFWKLYACLTGKQYYGYLTGKQDLKDIFGSYSLMNVLFPYNGLIGKRNVNNCRYQMKEV